MHVSSRICPPVTPHKAGYTPVRRDRNWCPRYWRILVLQRNRPTRSDSRGNHMRSAYDHSADYYCIRTSSSMAVGVADTVGCPSVKDFATSGWPISRNSNSRQYENHGGLRQNRQTAWVFQKRFIYTRVGLIWVLGPAQSRWIRPHDCFGLESVVETDDFRWYVAPHLSHPDSNVPFSRVID